MVFTTFVFTDNPCECADALGIHRNSLRYRMERIAELSGVDPLRLDGMLALYLGVQLLPQTDPSA
jgi:carbohydrate diacid regulator